MEVDAVCSFDGFLGLKPHWNRVLSESGQRSVFLSFEWLTNWWRVFGAKRRLLVLVARRKGEIAGLAPLMVTRKGALFLRARALEFIASPLSDYTDFIVAGERKEVIGAFISRLLGLSSLWDYLCIGSVRKDSENLGALEEALSGAGLRWREEARNLDYFMPLEDGWEKQKRALKRNVKSDVKRRMNRLRAEGELGFEALSKDEALRLLPVFFGQHRMRLSEKGGIRSMFEDGGHRRFIEGVVSDGIEKGYADLTALTLDGEPIAIHLGLSHGGTYYYYIPAYDPRFGRFSPGKVLIYNLIRSRCEKGDREFDFLLGRERYKGGWTEGYRELSRLTAAKDTAYGRALLFWVSRARPLARGLLPRRLRPALSG